MSIEAPENKSIEQWGIPELERAVEGVDNDRRLAPFNDVILGTETPSEELQKRFVIRDVSIGGKICDVYHWDQDQNGQKIPNSTIHRVFVHVKG